MSSLPNSDARRQPDRVENPPISGDFRHPRPPSHLVAKPRLWDAIYPDGRELRIEIPRLDQLVMERPMMSAIHVYRFLNMMGRRLREDDRAMRRGAWVRTSTIAKEAGLAESTVRTVALPWLIEHGWIACEGVTIGASDRVMLWCLWLLPDDLAGRDCHLGQGLEIRGEDATIVPARGPGRRRAAADSPPLFSADGAGECAHPAAPKGSKRESKSEANVTLRRPSPGGEGSKIPDATGGAPAPSPEASPAPPPPRVPSPPEACLAALEAAPVRFPITVAQALWDLVDQGVPLPGAWAKVRMPPRPVAPAEEPAAPPRPAKPPAPSTTLDLTRRLPGATGDAAAGLIAELAARYAREWDDWGSLAGFKPKLALAAAKVPAPVLVAAYRKAKRCGPDATPGAIWHSAINAYLKANP